MSRYISGLLTSTLLGALAFLPFVVHSAELRADEQVNIAQSETLSGDVYTLGGMVSTASNISGDLVSAGGTILVSGDVAEDANLGGGTITVSGKTGDDLRAVGGTIVVTGEVGGDLVVAGGQVQITGERIGGDFVAGAGTLHLTSPVEGTVRAGGGTIYLDAPVKGSVHIVAEELTLGKNALIEGTLFYRSQKKAIMEEGAIVRGEIIYEEREGRKIESPADIGLLLTAAAFAQFLIVFASGLFLSLFFAKYVRSLIHAAFSSPIIEAGKGFLAFVALPIAAFVLFGTVIGSLFGLLSIIGFFALIVSSMIIAPILLGSAIFRLATQRKEYEVSWRTILLGAVVYSFLGFLPVLGWVVILAFIFLSAGAVLKIKWHVLQEWR